jgi:hypothetical protein
MKRSSLSVFVASVVLALFVVSAPVTAHDYQRNNSDHPFRVVAYFLHPVGIGLEYGVTRPVHWVVSQPNMRILFGHAPRHELDELGRYPVCNLCQGTPPVVECPSCHKKLLKPRDEYWTWR